MEANYVHKDSTTLVQDELVKNELNQIELQYNALKQQKFNELLKENQELKKQLKPNYYVTGLEGTLKEYQQEMKNVAIQQKEFINYLENEIKLYENDIQNFKKDYKVYFSLINDLRVSKAKIEEILQKYKEIIGVSDENSKN